jgi:hypothetical protein
VSRAVRAALPVVLLAGACGCASMSTLDRARTLSKGQVRISPAAGTIGSVSDEGSAFHPRAELGLGYGAEEGVEVFGKLWYAGVTGGTKVRVTQSGSEDSGVDVAIAPAVGWQWSDKYSFELPLLAGLNTGSGNQLVMAIRPSYVAWASPGGLDRPVSFVFLGGSLGFWWRVADSFALVPEVAWAGNVFAEEGFGTLTAGGLGLQLSLGAAILK